MKFGLVQERKNPPDKRVVFSPQKLKELKAVYPNWEFVVETSPVRVFPDEAYLEQGIEVVQNLNDCDVLLGVKEIPVDALIPNKKYFFFSHTIKKQPYNQKLLQAILDKNITLFDHETIVNEHNQRLIGFGKYAGIVGAYNGFRAFGIKFELFKLPKAETLTNQAMLVKELKKVVFPPLKVVLTGTGKVGLGAKEVLDAIKFKEVSVEDFLHKNYAQPVYTQIDVLDYNQRIDGQVLEKEDFYQHPEAYQSNFGRFTQVADIFMAGHFYDNRAPKILTREMLLDAACKIKVVADISCDVDGPIACTLRASTIADPLYGYDAKTNQEVDVFHPNAVVVMAVDNLPCELPLDASEGFGEMFATHVLPAFANGDANGILERAKITENCKLTPRFSYLEDYAFGGLIKY